MTTLTCTACGTIPAYHASGYELPLCEACWTVRSGRGLEPRSDDRAGMVVRNVSGVGTDGRPATDGADGWEFRKPVKHPDEHHTDPIQLGVETGWQQSTPIHVPGSPPRVGSGKGVMAGATRATERSDAGRDVATISDAAGLTPWQRQVKLVCAEGYSYQEAADVLGCTVAAVHDAVKRANKHMETHRPKEAIE